MATKRHQKARKGGPRLAGNAATLAVLRRDGVACEGGADAVRDGGTREVITTRLWAPTPTNLRRLGAALRRGELVAAPTETVYGLAGDALNPAAARAIFAAKARPAHDPLIVHVLGVREVARVAVLDDPALRAAVGKLAAAFWPGPLTLVLPKRAEVPDAVTSGGPSVAVRVPRHRVFRALLRAAGCPLAAPSANPFGYVSPTTAAHVRDGLDGRIPHILDGGACGIGVESTVLDVRDPRRPVLLRPGAVTAEQLAAVLGVPVRRARKNPRAAPPVPGVGEVEVSGPSGAADVAEVSPGLLERHYSPATPLTLHARVTAAQLRAGAADEAWLLTRPPADAALRRAKNIFWLDSRGDVTGAARRLFAQLRALDDGRWCRLHAEQWPGRAGLADAINDRLRRAAARR